MIDKDGPLPAEIMEERRVRLLVCAERLGYGKLLCVNTVGKTLRFIFERKDVLDLDMSDIRGAQFIKDH